MQNNLVDEKMATKKVLFEVHGFEVHSDTIYSVRDKIDYDAPAGFIEQGLSKVPGTGDSASCPYDQASKVYDHGFDVLCPRYRHVSDVEAKGSVKELLTNVVKPYEKISSIPTERLTSLGELEFWDNFTVEFDEDTKFNTRDPRQTLNLYISLISGKLCPKGMENQPYFKTSAYTVDSMEKTYKRTSEAVEAKQDANFNFVRLARKGDLEVLKAILKYCGIDSAESATSRDSLGIIFSDKIERHVEKVKEFNDTVDFYESSTEAELEVQLFRKLSILGKNKKGKLVISKTSGISYDGIELGKDFRTVSKKLAKQETEEYSRIVEEVLEFSVK